MRPLAESVVSHRWGVIAVWLIVAVVVGSQAPRLARELDVVARVSGSEAVETERAIAARFESPFAHFAVLVATQLPAIGSTEGVALLRELNDTLRAIPGVSGTYPYLDARDSLMVGTDEHSAFVVVGLDPNDGRLDAMIPRLRAVTGAFSRLPRAQHDTLALRWTGEIAINADLRQTSAEQASRAEARAMPVTLVLLLLAFGTIVAALLPLVTGVMTISVALGAVVLLNQVWPLSILVQSTVSMIGLGVGIDYALLTVSRFREAVRAGKSAHAAAVDASHHAGTTIALSAATVIIGFAALTIVPLNELRSTGVGGVIVVFIAACMSMTFLPALLAVLGTRLEKGRIAALTRAGSVPEDRWRAWGRLVARHPWRVLALAGTPLVVLAYQARHLSPEVPRGDWLPARMESAQAMTDLRTMGRGGVVNALRMIVEVPSGVAVDDSVGWSAVRRVTAWAAGDARVARAQSVASLASKDRRAAIIDIVPGDTVDFADVTNLVRDIRGADLARVSGVAGTSAIVGGMAAFNADYVEAIGRRAVRVVALVVLATFVAMVIAFRSILVPVKALALNLLSVGAALGAIVLVFQDGYGGALFGIANPLHGVFPAIPLVVFCIVFGMSMDYEVFLVARVAEARTTMSDEDALVEGLTRTGGLITSAAAIMIAVFGAFALGDFLFIKVLGVALSVAIFVDATFVRLAIGPALFSLAGRWNWWPGDALGRRERAHAQVSLNRAAVRPDAFGTRAAVRRSTRSG
jgi:RND superfamily putative drug exporter